MLARRRGPPPRALVVTRSWGAGTPSGAQRRWRWSGCGSRWAGWRPAALDRPGGRDAAPGPRALPGAVVWPGACRPRGGWGPRPPRLAPARALCGWHPAGARWPQGGGCTAGPSPARLGGVALPWRRVPRVGPAAAARSPHVPAAGPAPEACPPAAGPHAAGAAAWAARPGWHAHRGAARDEVGPRSDGAVPPAGGAGGPCSRRGSWRRSVRGPPRGHAGAPGGSLGAQPPRGPHPLWGLCAGQRPRRGPPSGAWPSREGAGVAGGTALVGEHQCAGLGPRTCRPGGAERCRRTRQAHRFGRTPFETVADRRLALHALQRPDHATWLMGRHG